MCLCLWNTLKHGYLSQNLKRRRRNTNSGDGAACAVCLQNKMSSLWGNLLATWRTKSWSEQSTTILFCSKATTASSKSSQEASLENFCWCAWRLFVVLLVHGKATWRRDYWRRNCIRVKYGKVVSNHDRHGKTVDRRMGRAFWQNHNARDKERKESTSV